MNHKALLAGLTGTILCSLGLLGSCASSQTGDRANQTPGTPAPQAAVSHNTSPGEFDKLAYPSSTTGVERQAWVWTPANLDPAARYPVLYVLHGIGGNEDEWINNARPQIILDELLEAGQIRPMIVVFPNGRALADDTVPRNPFSPEAMEGFSRFTQDLQADLIPWVEARFPASRDRTQRGICGLSMGGGQSLNIGLGYPEQFNYVGAFSSAPNTDPGLFRLDNPAVWPKVVWLTCGLSDGLLNVSEKADQVLSDAGVPHTFHTMPGNHDWSVWTWSFTNFVQLAFK